ncbi:hypothetical protein CPB85DRAFT_1341634 [Mucidula mucida]|nr:hypothetical protein CPB85DRAFT_1341634 [Mucidula mucida]
MHKSRLHSLFLFLVLHIAMQRKVHAVRRHDHSMAVAHLLMQLGHRLSPKVNMVRVDLRPHVQAALLNIVNVIVKVSIEEAPAFWCCPVDRVGRGGPPRSAIKRVR